MSDVLLITAKDYIEMAKRELITKGLLTDQV